MQPDISEMTGLEPALIERIWSSVGFPIGELNELTDDDAQAIDTVHAQFGIDDRAGIIPHPA